MVVLYFPLFKSVAALLSVFCYYSQLIFSFVTHPSRENQLWTLVYDQLLYPKEVPFLILKII